MQKTYRIRGEDKDKKRKKKQEFRDSAIGLGIAGGMIGGIAGLKYGFLRTPVKVFRKTKKMGSIGRGLRHVRLGMLKRRKAKFDRLFGGESHKKVRRTQESHINSVLSDIKRTKDTRRAYKEVLRDTARVYKRRKMAEGGLGRMDVIDIGRRPIALLPGRIDPNAKKFTGFNPKEKLARRHWAWAAKNTKDMEDIYRSLLLEPAKKRRKEYLSKLGKTKRKTMKDWFGSY